MNNGNVLNNEIELLAPAGSMKQALMCIESGCNAVYGGLKKWNARMNAQNFSIEEYKKITFYCHQKNVKFYMTLNTLFKDTELKEVIDLFSDKDFILPDAVIAADVGLITTISKLFPTIDIHASTQFGTTSIDDINFLKKFNVKRVILARELTLDEIKKIRSQSDIQLEVFVYGSQCICFSGQCLWGGLTQERSGNRGRCPATCRDFYESNKISGQLLYPQDIDASRMIYQLKEAGIDSIKIEGRFRDSKQIAITVNSFRKAIDCSNSDTNIFDKNNKYVGYLGNNLPVHGLLNLINPRIPVSSIRDMEYGPHDLLTEVNSYNRNNVRYGDTNNSGKCNKKYIKTIYSEPLCNTNDGVVMNLIFTDNILEKINITNNIGVEKSFLLDNNDLRTITVSDVVSSIMSKISFKLMEITSNRPELSKIECDVDEVLRTVYQINHYFEIIPRPIISDIDVPKRDDILQINKSDILCNLKKKGFHNFIFNILSINELKKAILCEDEQDNIIYRISFLDFNNKEDVIIEYLKGRSIMIGKWSQLLLTETSDFKEVYADYTLNAWNHEALSILADYGVKKYIAHPETTLEYNIELTRNSGIDAMAIYISRIPIGYTRACFGELGICDKNCGHTEFSLKNITKKYFISVFCNNELGFRVLTTSFINVAFRKICRFQRIFDFSFLSEEEMQSVLIGQISNSRRFVSIYGRELL